MPLLWSRHAATVSAYARHSANPDAAVAAASRQLPAFVLIEIPAALPGRLDFQTHYVIHEYRPLAVFAAAVGYVRFVAGRQTRIGVR